MRTRRIPAQITTVEDMIVGNLNFVQLLLLMVPIGFFALAYVFFPAPLQITGVKLMLTFLVFVISGLLALRIQEKIILDWVVILLRYRMRPSFYVFDKNDVSFRTVDVLPEEHKRTFFWQRNVHPTSESLVQISYPHTAISELIKLETLLKSPNISIGFKTLKQGGVKLDVAFEQISN